MIGPGDGVLITMRRVVSRFISERSCIRQTQYPSRMNTVQSISLIILSLPLSLVIAIVLVFRRVARGPYRVLVVDIDSEFGHFVQVMERQRILSLSIPQADLCLVLSRLRFEGLARLYSASFGVPILFGVGVNLLLQQAVLLQPRWLVSTERRSYQRSNLWMNQSRTALELPKHLVELRESVLAKANCIHSHYVAMAVYSMHYDEAHSPAQVAKQRACESVGSELAPAVDVLRELGIGVFLLGSPDTGPSRVPRDLPRLANFDKLGGNVEVALTSGCYYFWSDGIGAHWLAVPFLTPVLITNHARYIFSLGNQYLVHLTGYESVEGHPVSLRQLLHMELREGRTPYKEASAGRLRLVRNTPDEVICVHQEMLSHLSGEHVETNEVRDIRERFTKIYHEFGLTAPHVSGEYLQRHRQTIL